MPKNVLPEKQIQGNPLEFHLRTFTSSLLERGYRNKTIEMKLYLLADFGRWFGRSGRPVSHVDELLVKAFAKHKRHLHLGGPKTLQQFLDHLRERNVIPDRKPVRAQSPLSTVLGEFGNYLRSERGLVTCTIRDQQSYARQFLDTRFPRGPLVLEQLKAADISDFVLRHSHSKSIGRAHSMTTALRSFLRFLFQKGKLRADLAACVPAVADWRRSTVPKYLTAEEVKRVLGACNRDTAIGRRDYAILLLLARLGLRAGEVVALQLEDINWRAGEVLVRGKGLLHDRMPLPADVGKALACYLRRDRPACQTRRVFVRMKAPYRGLADRATVPTIVRYAIERANLHPPFKGAHLLRHSLATSMLRSGATMAEIGEVLRHRAPNTTEIYAKVDFDGLRSVAHAWPTGGGQ
jgi:site-specific recombinase XerC